MIQAGILPAKGGSHTSLPMKGHLQCASYWAQFIERESRYLRSSLDTKTCREDVVSISCIQLCSKVICHTFKLLALILV